MIRTLLLFFAADALGEAMHRLLHLPIPGPVLGMVLLFALFARLGPVPTEIAQTGRAVLRLLPLFFVPAGVGAIEHAALIARYWPAILAALAGSSLAALLVTGFALHALERNNSGAHAIPVARERKS
jgi:holin-like protein